MNIADFEGQSALITFQPFLGPVEGFKLENVWYLGHGHVSSIPIVCYSEPKGLFMVYSSERMMNNKYVYSKKCT